MARNRSALLVNPLDSKHIMGVEEINSADGATTLRARVSFDGGVAWRESWPLVTEPGWTAVVGPALAMDARGTLNLAALALEPDRSRAWLVVYQSEDGGIRWTKPVTVLSGTAECCYSIATDLNKDSAHRGKIYVVADMDDALSFACSLDGEKWSGSGDPQPGLLMPGKLCFYPDVLVDATGAVHILWMTGPSGDRIVSTASRDGGHTFGPTVTVARGITGVREGLPATVPATGVTSDGLMICAWADDREGRSRIFCRRSVDYGRTWQGPASGEPLLRERVTDQHEFQPHLIITAAGEICCAFYEYGPKPPEGSMLVDLVMAISYDRGETFTGHMVLSQHPWDPSDGQPLSPAAMRGALGWLAIG